MPERELARITAADVIIEDHGLPTLHIMFDYDGSGQGLGYYQLCPCFIIHFLKAVGVEAVSQCIGRSLWVTHDHCDIHKIEPLHRGDGVPFVIAKWKHWVQAGCHCEDSICDMEKFAVKKPKVAGNV